MDSDDQFAVFFLDLSCLVGPGSQRQTCGSKQATSKIVIIRLSL